MVKKQMKKNEIKIFSHIVICQIQYLLKLVFGGSYHSIDYAKAFECVDHNTLWKILKDWNTRPPDLPLEKPVCRSESNS